MVIGFISREVRTSHICRVWVVLRENGESGIGDDENRQLCKRVATKRHRQMG